MKWDGVKRGEEGDSLSWFIVWLICTSPMCKDDRGAAPFWFFSVVFGSSWYFFGSFWFFFLVLFGTFLKRDRLKRDWGGYLPPMCKDNRGAGFHFGVALISSLTSGPGSMEWQKWNSSGDLKSIFSSQPLNVLNLFSPLSRCGWLSVCIGWFGNG